MKRNLPPNTEARPFYQHSDLVLPGADNYERHVADCEAGYFPNCKAAAVMSERDLF